MNANTSPETPITHGVNACTLSAANGPSIGEIFSPVANVNVTNSIGAKVTFAAHMVAVDPAFGPMARRLPNFPPLCQSEIESNSATARALHCGEIRLRTAHGSNLRICRVVATERLFDTRRSHAAGAPKPEVSDVHAASVSAIRPQQGSSRHRPIDEMPSISGSNPAPALNSHVRSAVCFSLSQPWHAATGVGRANQGEQCVFAAGEIRWWAQDCTSGEEKAAAAAGSPATTTAAVTDAGEKDGAGFETGRRTNFGASENIASSICVSTSNERVVPAAGLESARVCLQSSCSTSELYGRVFGKWTITEDQPSRRLAPTTSAGE